MRRWLVRIAIAAAALLVLAQLVPYGRAHTNPPVRSEPRWSSPEVRALAVRACFDCHSNESRWPWYSNIAPVSWLVQGDVDSGRRALNFSEWGTGEQELREIVEAVRGGGMPPIQYKLAHSGARLSAAEREQLARGLEATLGG